MQTILLRHVRAISIRNLCQPFFSLDSNEHVLLNGNGSSVYPSQRKGEALADCLESFIICSIPCMNDAQLSVPISVPSTSKLHLSPPTPFWCSPIHPPSHNPNFWMESTNDDEFFLRVGREDGFIVDVWGRTSHVGKGKEKAKDDGWRMLQRFQVNLNDCVRLGKDPAAIPTPLPQNALLLQIATSPTTLEWFLHFSSMKKGESLGGKNQDETVVSDSDTRQSYVEHGPLDLSLPAKDRDRVLELSQYETRMLSSYSMNGMSKLIEAGKSVEDLSMEHSQLQLRVSSALSQDSIFFTERAILERSEIVRTLETLRTERCVYAQRLRLAIGVRKQELAARSVRLNQAGKLLEKRDQELETMKEDLRLDKGIWDSIRLSIRHRMSTLIQQLSDIYPIAPSSIEDPNLSDYSEYCILNHALPNSPFPTKAYGDDDVLSSALGYVTQLTLLLSTYLSIPIHYPLKPMGSRSLVMDPISSLKGQRWFPLYGKGVDRYRFDYAVFLLNKDVEQLLYSQKLPVKDLRNTLPNLAFLCLSITSDKDTPISTPLPSRQNSINSLRVEKIKTKILQLDGATYTFSSSSPLKPPPSSSTSIPSQSSATSLTYPPGQHPELKLLAKSPDKSVQVQKNAVSLSLVIPEGNHHSDEETSNSPASTVRAGGLNGRSGSIRSIKSFVGGNDSGDEKTGLVSESGTVLPEHSVFQQK